MKKPEKAVLRRLALPISVVINEVVDLRFGTEEEFCEGILHVTRVSGRNETGSLGGKIPSRSRVDFH